MYVTQGGPNPQYGMAPIPIATAAVVYPNDPQMNYAGMTAADAPGSIPIVSPGVAAVSVAASSSKVKTDISNQFMAASSSSGGIPIARSLPEAAPSGVMISFPRAVSVTGNSNSSSNNNNNNAVNV